MLGWQVGAKVNFPHHSIFRSLPPFIIIPVTATLNTHFVGDPTFIDADGNRVTA